MATVNLGRIKPVFRGAYSGSTAYVVDDIVTHGNESFICIQAHGAGTQATSVTAYWTKLAAKGSDGTDVGTTITAQGDILYRDGSGLQKLAKPASNKFLQNTSGGVLTWEDVSTNHTGVAWLEYKSTSGFGDLHSTVGFTGSHDRGVLAFNTVTDPYNILGTIGTNTFQVNSTGAYLANINARMHTAQHYILFLYNDTDSKFAERPNAGWDGTTALQMPMMAYNGSQGELSNIGDVYWLETGHTYTARMSNDGTTSGMTTSTSHLQASYTVNGVAQNHSIVRTILTKLSGV